MKVEIEGVKAWFKLQQTIYLGKAEVVGRAMKGVKKMQKGRIVKRASQAVDAL